MESWAPIFPQRDTGKPPPFRAASPNSAHSKQNGSAGLVTCLLEAGLLTLDRLKYAHRVQKKVGDKPLIQVLVELSIVSRSAMTEVFRKNLHRISAASLLLELGELEESSVSDVQSEYERTRGMKRLSSCLFERGLLDEASYGKVIAHIGDYRFVMPTEPEVDTRALTQVSPTQCLKHLMLPLKGSGAKQTLAVADLLTPGDVKAAVQCFGEDIDWVISTPHVIETLLQKYCRPKASSASAEVGTENVIDLVDQVLSASLRANASDIHFDPLPTSFRIRFRVDGVLATFREFPVALHSPMTNRLKVMSEADLAERRRHQDGRLAFEDSATGAKVDFRSSFFVTVHGEASVLRALGRTSSVLRLRDMGIPRKFLTRFIDEALETPSGVIMMTGPTGTGKTTTLYACVNELNRSDTRIMTAEDPVEREIDGVFQCSMNLKINRSFEETLKHMMRQDPDVIMLGEVRDKFSCETAIHASLTGHKVLTTFHTEDAVGALVRLSHMEIEPFLLSSTMNAVVAQRLIRKICPFCAEPHQPSPTELRRVRLTPRMVEGLKFMRGRGCSECKSTGYRGRFAVFEILIVGNSVREAILMKLPTSELRARSLEDSGLVTLLEHGLLKAANGETTLEEVTRWLPRLHTPRPIEEIRRLTGEFS